MARSIASVTALRRCSLVGAVALVGVALAFVSPLSGAIVLVGAAGLLVVLRVLHDLNRRQERLDAIHAFTRDLGQALAHGEVLDATLRSMVTLLQVERSGLLLLESESVALRTVHRPGEGLRSTRSEAAELRALLATFPPEAWSGRTFDETDTDLTCVLSTEASPGIAVRLGSASSPVGLLVAGRRRDTAEPFTADDVELLRVMAAHAGAAISNELLMSRLRREAEDREHEATHDHLTGLVNREGFRVAIERALGGVEVGRSVGVIVLDLHRFRDVNDGLGLDAGDRLLRVMAERFRSVAPEGVVARLGGDEFGILISSTRVRDALSAVTRGLGATFRDPVVIDDVPVEVTASLGIAIGPDHGRDAGWLLRRADTALRRAVATGKPAAVYDVREDEREPAQLSLVGELRAAIDAGELVAYFQPKLDAASGQIVGAEALVRWIHPDRGLIPPDQFIPVAERTGLIAPLTTCVLEQAIAQVAAWNAAGHDVGVAVNISARSLSTGELARDVAVAVHAAGIRPDRLTLEVTESTVMEASGRADTTLRRLDELGVRLSIDDFGTGYSSLSYLRSLPVSELKVDRSFVMRLPAEPEDQVIVRSTIELAHNLGLRVVAEGVEDEESIELLRAMGCDLLQGYHTGRPMPGTDLTARLDRERDARTDADGGEAAVLPLRRSV